MIRLVTGAACVLALLGAQGPLAVAQFANGSGSLLPGSRFAVRFASAGTFSSFAAIGTGHVENGFYVVPLDARPGRATLVAVGPSGMAVRRLRIVAPPRGAAIAVASYGDGIVFHDPRTFAVLGTLATGGAPSDVAPFGDSGVATTDTDGSAVTMVGMQPWNVRTVGDVPLGDELAADPPLHALFVSERELNGSGGLARIRAGRVESVVTGTTAEGVVVDPFRERVYVADANGGDIAIVDARAMRVIGRVGGIPRAFALALSRNGRYLYAVSNQGEGTLFRAAGFVSKISLGRTPRIIARSAPLTFPVGIALDGERHELYVTDEEKNEIVTLDASTLHPRAAALSTCAIPWKPLFDPQSARLYVPCAGSNEIDVIDVQTFRRVAGAPFHTGNYPLAVANIQ